MGELREALDRSVIESSLIQPVDEALVEAGRKLADEIDAAQGADRVKAMYLVPHLANILRELLATPASRVKLPKNEEEPGDPVDELRNRRAKKSA